jgi:hypothetical protein
MICNVLVSAQYYENYSDTETPYWKPKGGADFSFLVDSELVMYTPEDVLREALSKLIVEQSNEHSRYEYFSHEVKFSSPKMVEGLGEELERIVSLRFHKGIKK